MLNNFFPKCGLWDNEEKYCRAGLATDDSMAYDGIPKAINTHSEYVKLVALPLQLWLHKRTSLLRYTYIASLVVCFLLGNSPASEFYIPTFRNTFNFIGKYV
jgi:hypothetical protein